MHNCCARTYRMQSTCSSPNCTGDWHAGIICSRLQPLGADNIAWFTARHISPATLQRNKIQQCVLEDNNGEIQRVLAFVHYDNDGISEVKLRTRDKQWKHYFKTKGKAALSGIQDMQLLDTVIIVEGMCPFDIVHCIARLLITSCCNFLAHSGMAISPTQLISSSIPCASAKPLCTCNCGLCEILYASRECAVCACCNSLASVDACTSATGCPA